MIVCKRERDLREGEESVKECVKESNREKRDMGDN